MKALKFFLTLNAAILLIAAPLILVSEARAEMTPIQGLSHQPSEAAALMETGSLLRQAAGAGFRLGCDYL